MKRVLVACGNGIATSTVVATKIREKCEENGVAVTVNQCKLLEVESKADDYDLLVTTGKFTGGTVTIPVITAISLLTGIGEEATLDQIVEELKKLSKQTVKKYGNKRKYGNVSGGRQYANIL